MAKITWDWITGFYEGEGSAWINGGKYAGMCFYQKEKQVLSVIQKFVGCGRLRSKRRPKQICKKIWSLEFTSREDVHYVLRSMLPFMHSTKKIRQAKKVLRRSVL